MSGMLDQLRKERDEWKWNDFSFQRIELAWFHIEFLYIRLYLCTKQKTSQLYFNTNVLYVVPICAVSTQMEKDRQLVALLAKLSFQIISLKLVRYMSDIIQTNQTPKPGSFCVMWHTSLGSACYLHPLIMSRLVLCGCITFSLCCRSALDCFNCQPQQFKSLEAHSICTSH